MHGLCDVDITTARTLLREREPPLSLTAFIIASIGRAAAAHPQGHAYRDGVAGWSNTASSTYRP